MPTPTLPTDATASVSPGSHAPVPPAPSDGPAPVPPCNPAQTPPPASGDDGGGDSGASGDHGGGTALTQPPTPPTDAIVSVSPDGNVPAPPVPPGGGRAPAPPALSDDPAPVPPCDPAPAPPPALGDSGDDGGTVAPVPTLTPPTDTAASVSLDSRAPAPPVRPSGPAPVPPYDPAPAPPPASGTPGVPRLDEHILSRTALADGTLVAADTHGAPGTAPGNAGTGDDTGATAAAVTTRRGGVEGTLHRGGTSGDSTVRRDACGGGHAGGTATADHLPPVSPGHSVPAPSAPPGGSAPAPPSGPVLTLPGSPAPQPLTEPTPPQPPDSPVSVPPSDPAPALPPASGAPRVPHIFLRRRDTHVLPPVDNSLTAADTLGTPGTALASAGRDDRRPATCSPQPRSNNRRPWRCHQWRCTSRRDPSQQHARASP